MGGTKLLDTDRENRSLGLVWGAEKKFASYDKSSPAFKAMMAYADGVNWYIDHMKPRDLPIEYRLLNARPMKWEPIYSLYFLSRMSLTLGFNDATAAAVESAVARWKAAADALFPVNSPIQQPIQPSRSFGPATSLRRCLTRARRLERACCCAMDDALATSLAFLQTD